MTSGAKPDGVRPRVLLTGATGAVGRCVVDELLQRSNCELIVVARDARRLPPSLSAHPRLTVLTGDVAGGKALAERLPPVDRAIFLAAAWGSESHDVNLTGTLALADALHDRGVQQLIWFGTASIVTHDGAPHPDAVTRGTPYITTKALCREGLLQRRPPGLTIVHPTLVIAGGDGTPESHLTRLLREIERHAWLAQWVRGEGSFHLVHAADLARLVRQLLARPPGGEPREIIAGAPALTINDALEILLARTGRQRRRTFELTPARIEWLIRLFRVDLSPWDRLCLDARHFTYRDAVLSDDPGEPPRYGTAAAIIGAIPPLRA